MELYTHLGVVIYRRIPWVRAGYTRGRRRARIDGFFFKIVPYMSYIRTRRGYTGTTGTGVLGHTGRERDESAGQTL
jgi:hypothetical protein